MFPQCGNRAFIFLNGNTIVAGRATENAKPSLSFFPYLTLALPDEGGENGGRLRIRLNLGIPIHYDPELRVHLPFVVNPSQQILFAFVFFLDSEGDLAAKPHSITIPLSVLRDWAWSGTSGGIPQWVWSYTTPTGLHLLSGHDSSPPMSAL